MRNHWISLITLLTLTLTSCGAFQTSKQNIDLVAPSQEFISTPLTQPELTETERSAISPSSQPAIPDVQYPEAEKITVAPREIIEKIKADLVKQFGLSADQIRVEDVRAVTWPDTSLGCPRPDSVYAQVVTPGYWILLETKGQLYPYHTDQNDQIVLCLGNTADPDSEVPLPLIPVNPDEIDDGQPWKPVN